MRIIKLIIILIVVIISFSFSIKRDYVPDETTAIKIAKAVWLPIYGESIKSKKPYKAVLQGDTAWHVFGTLPQSKLTVTEVGDSVLHFHTGGVPHIIISKKDGKIWDVYHGK